MKRMRVVLLSAAVITIGAVLAFALPAGADVSTQSVPLAAIQVGPTGVLQARGAFVEVPVTIVCLPGVFSGDISMQVTQRSGSGIAQGNAFVAVSQCTGNFQTIEISVPASPFGEEFRKGAAFASATFFLCDFTGCASNTDQREIEIVRR
jgi:hypothetical protein